MNLGFIVSNKSEKLKLSFIGCGRVFSHYMTILQKYDLLTQFTVEALCDTSVEKTSQPATYLDSKSFSSLSALLMNSNSDLYIVLTPSGTHFEVVRELLEHNRNVLVEKPGTLKLNQSQILEEMAFEKSLFLGCVHQNRYNLAIQEAKKLLESNGIGKIINFSVRLRWSRTQDYYNDGWHGTWVMDGGVSSQQAFHHLDALRYLLGEVDSGYSFGSQARHRLEAEDTSVAVFRMNSGAIGTFEATTTMLDSDREASVEIFGENGHICIGGIALNEITGFYSQLVSRLESDRLCAVNEFVDNGYGNSHYPLLLAVRKALLEGNLSYDISWKDSTKTLELIHLLYASQEQNRVINSRDHIQSFRLGKGN